MAVHEWAYPVYLQVYGDEEGNVVEEEDYFSSVAQAETFFEENYNRPGVSAGVYELTTVLRFDTPSKKEEDLDDLEDLKSQMESLLRQVNEVLKERR